MNDSSVLIFKFEAMKTIQPYIITITPPTGRRRCSKHKTQIVLFRKVYNNIVQFIFKLSYRISFGSFLLKLSSITHQHVLAERQFFISFFKASFILLSPLSFSLSISISLTIFLNVILHACLLTRNRLLGSLSRRYLQYKNV